MTAIRTVDYHTGGEPFRIVTGGVEPLEGATILERRRDALERLDHVRRLLVNEPRGHADMYGCHVVPGERRGRRPRGRVLPQRGLLDRLRARDDRARHLGARRGHRRAARGREPRRRRRSLRPARDRRGRRATAASARSPSATCRRSSGRTGVRVGEVVGRHRLRRRVLRVVARAGGAGRAAAPDRARAGDQARPRGASTRSCIRSSPSFATSTASSSGSRRATAPLDPAQRDGVRRRRGRPLALRIRAPRRGSRCSTPAGSCPAAPSCATCRSSARASSVASSTRSDVAGRPAVVTEVTGSAYRTGESTFTLDPDDPLGEGFLLR